MPVAVIVDWYGPYSSLDEIEKVVREEWWDEPRTLYMALSKGNIYQYVGLTKDPPSRINKSHHKLNHKDNKTFYVGHIVTQGITDPRKSKHRPDLRLAECALIYFLKPALNKHYKHKPPEDWVSIFSCFYDPKKYKPTKPLPKFPIVLAYNPDLRPKRLQWIVGK